MASHFGGKVGGSTHREYGHANVQVMKLGNLYELADKLLEGLEDGFQVAKLVHSAFLSLKIFRSGCHMETKFLKPQKSL